MADTFTVSNGSTALATDTASPVVINGLTPNTAYDGWMAVKNDGTNALQISEQVTLASKPTLTLVASDSGATATVKLADGDGPAPLTKVTVQYKTGTDDWTSVDGDVTTMTAVLTGLTNGTEYQVQAFVTNVRGDSDVSDPVAVTPVVLEPANTTDDATTDTAKAE